MKTSRCSALWAISALYPAYRYEWLYQKCEMTLFNYSCKPAISIFVFPNNEITRKLSQSSDHTTFTLTAEISNTGPISMMLNVSHGAIKVIENHWQCFRGSRRLKWSCCWSRTWMEILILRVWVSWNSDQAYRRWINWYNRDWSCCCPILRDSLLSNVHIRWLDKPKHKSCAL